MINFVIDFSIIRISFFVEYLDLFVEVDLDVEVMLIRKESWIEVKVLIK